MKTSSLVSLATAVLFATMYISAAPTPIPAPLPPRAQEESVNPVLSPRSTDPQPYTPASTSFSPQDICQPGRQEQVSAICNRHNYRYPLVQQAPYTNNSVNNNNNYNSYNSGDGNYRNNRHDRGSESTESMDSNNSREGERAERAESSSGSHPQEGKIRRRNLRVERLSLGRRNTGDGRIDRIDLPRRRYVSQSSGIGSMYAKDGTQGR